MTLTFNPRGAKVVIQTHSKMKVKGQVLETDGRTDTTDRTPLTRSVRTRRKTTEKPSWTSRRHAKSPTRQLADTKSQLADSLLD